MKPCAHDNPFTTAQGQVLCRTCWNGYMRAWHHKHREILNLRKRLKYLENKLKRAEELGSRPA